MWRIADGGGVEQLDGGFLHQRTHAPNPLRSNDLPGAMTGVQQIRSIGLDFIPKASSTYRLLRLPPVGADDGNAWGKGVKAQFRAS